MATFKLTWKRGQSKKDIVRAAGSAIAGSDAIELNVDVTNMNKGEVIQGLEQLIHQIGEKGFPQ